MFYYKCGILERHIGLHSTFYVKDFFTYGRNWNAQLCKADSDQDGRSNGEELGDPDCRWTAGQPSPTVNVTHPGMSEMSETGRLGLRDLSNR